MKDHEIREVVNAVTKVAREYHATEQLRERIRRAMEPLIAVAVVKTEVANALAATLPSDEALEACRLLCEAALVEFDPPKFVAPNNFAPAVRKAMLALQNDRGADAAGITDGPRVLGPLLAGVTVPAPTRYDCGYIGGVEGMHQRPDGDYVKWSDVAHLFGVGGTDA
jgi:hypothetical protein